MRDLPVHECFYTWQGEGCHMGRAAFFIRLYGCPVKCSWCDSAGTWHPNYKPDKLETRSVDELVSLAASSSCSIVVITGGEPAIHDLRDLCSGLIQAGLPVHLETCGAFPLKGEFSWVTLSPKWNALPLAENVRCADEIKLIVEDESSIGRWEKELGQLKKERVVWLHPEWGQKDNPHILNAISEKVKRAGDPFRAGFQIHKIYDVDSLDSLSKPGVYLG